MERRPTKMVSWADVISVAQLIGSLVCKETTESPRRRQKRQTTLILENELHLGFCRRGTCRKAYGKMALVKCHCNLNGSILQPLYSLLCILRTLRRAKQLLESQQEAKPGF